MIELRCTDWWVFIHCRAKKSSRLRNGSKLHLSIAYAAAGDQSLGKHLLLCSIGSRMKCLHHREVPLDFLLPNPLQLNLPEYEVKENSYYVCIHLPFFPQDSLLSFCPFQSCHLLSLLRYSFYRTWPKVGLNLTTSSLLSLKRRLESLTAKQRASNSHQMWASQEEVQNLTCCPVPRVVWWWLHSLLRVNVTKPPFPHHPLSLV